jgi:hypothetical protein
LRTSLIAGKEVTLTPGQTFYEGPKDVHTVGRNASATKPAKFLAILVKDQGKPALIPVSQPSARPPACCRRLYMMVSAERK